jgi:hypothetical protein
MNNIFINQEVAALLKKGAIEEVPLDPPYLGYISNVFLVPKKTGGMRPQPQAAQQGVAGHPSLHDGHR